MTFSAKLTEYVRRWNWLLVIVVLAAAGVATYRNTLLNPFVHDDVVFIVNNPQIENLDNVGAVFLEKPTANPRTPGINPYYRPLLEVISRVEYRFFGLDPQGYHWVNIIVHLLNSGLVYLSIVLLTRRRGWSWAVALIFLLHPVQSESVACISGISNLVFCLFSLAAFCLYVASERILRPSLRMLNYVLSLILFALALLAKEQSIFLIFIVLMYELYLRAVPPTRPSNKTWIRMAGLAAVGGGYLLLRKIVIGQALVSLFNYPYELWLRVQTIPNTLLMYLRILVIPNDLHYYRSVDVLTPVLLPLLIFAGVVAAVILILRFIPDTSRRLPVFGLGWFLVSVVPLSLLPLINEYSLIMVAEHFLYFAIIGFLLFFVVVIDYALETAAPQYKKLIAVVLVVMLAGGSAALTMRQNTFWRGEIPLFERTVQFQPNLGRVRILLAKAYYFQKEFNQAIPHYQKALEIMSRYTSHVNSGVAKEIYWTFIKGIHFDLAHCYEQLNLWEKAAEEYEQAVTIDPFDNALYNNLGAVYLRLNRTDDAQKNFEQAIRLNSRDVMALSNLAVCYLQRGDLNKAEAFLRRALKIDPYFVSARQNMEYVIKMKSASGLELPTP